LQAKRLISKFKLEKELQLESNCTQKDLEKICTFNFGPDNAPYNKQAETNWNQNWKQRRYAKKNNNNNSNKKQPNK